MRKILFIMSLMVCCTGIMQAEPSTLVAISADGSETSYALGNIQSVHIDNDQAEFIIKCKDESSRAGIRKILFATESTNIIEAKETKIYVFPNPVRNYLQVAGAPDNSEIRLYDINGRLYSITHENQINVSGLAQGIYFLKIENQTIKFIKQ